MEISFVIMAFSTHKFNTDKRPDPEELSVIRTNICNEWESNPLTLCVCWLFGLCEDIILLGDGKSIEGKLPITTHGSAEVTAYRFNIWQYNDTVAVFFSLLLVNFLAQV